MQGFNFMKNFKKLQLKKGISYIEVVAAITIFTMFGTALFLSQNYLFQRIAAAQWQLLAHDRMQIVLNDYKMHQIKNMLEKKSGEPKYKKSFKAPDMDITIEPIEKVMVSLAKNKEQEEEKSLLEQYDQIKTIKIAAIDEKVEKLVQYNFIYIPDFSEEEKS